MCAKAIVIGMFKNNMHTPWIKPLPEIQDKNIYGDIQVIIKTQY